MTKKQLQKIILKMAKSYSYDVNYVGETEANVIIDFYHIYFGDAQPVAQWKLDMAFFEFYLRDQLIKQNQKGEKNG